MSFGLGVSFGRLCRLEKQRREAFCPDELVCKIELNDYIYCEYKERERHGIIFKPFSLFEKKAANQIFIDEAIEYWY